MSNDDPNRMSDYDPNYVVAPFKSYGADYAARLINFKTGHADLETQHRSWLDDLKAAVPGRRLSKIYIYAFASKLGNAEKNFTLSERRGWAADSHLSRNSSDIDYTLSIQDFFMGEGGYGTRPGEAGYGTAQNDNDKDWRAVEVHCFVNNPPKVDPKAVPLPRPNGTTGSWDWSYSGNLSMMATTKLPAGPTAGVGFFRFKEGHTNEIRTYMAPLFGGTAGKGIPELLKWKFGKQVVSAEEQLAKDAEETALRILKHPGDAEEVYKLLRHSNWKEIGKSLLKGISASLWTSWKKCHVYHSFAFSTIDGLTIANFSVSAALAKGGRIQVYGNNIAYRDKWGTQRLGFRKYLEADASGLKAQWPSLAASAVGGPLLML